MSGKISVIWKEAQWHSAYEIVLGGIILHEERIVGHILQHSWFFFIKYPSLNHDPNLSLDTTKSPPGSKTSPRRDQTSLQVLENGRYSWPLIL